MNTFAQFKQLLVQAIETEKASGGGVETRSKTVVAKAFRARGFETPQENTQIPARQENGTPKAEAKSAFPGRKHRGVRAEQPAALDRKDGYRARREPSSRAPLITRREGRSCTRRRQAEPPPRSARRGLAV